MALFASRIQRTELATATQRHQSSPAQADRSEGMLEYGHVHHEGLQRERQSDRGPEPAIGEQADERAPLV